MKRKMVAAVVTITTILKVVCAAGRIAGVHGTITFNKGWDCQSFGYVPLSTGYAPRRSGIPKSLFVQVVDL